MLRVECTPYTGGYIHRGPRPGDGGKLSDVLLYYYTIMPNLRETIILIGEPTLDTYMWSQYDVFVIAAKRISLGLKIYMNRRYYRTSLR